MKPASICTLFSQHPDNFSSNLGECEVSQHTVLISPLKVTHPEELTIWSLIKSPMNDLTVNKDSLSREVVETDDVRDSVVVHTYAPTGHRSRLAKSHMWKPVFNHDFSKKSVPMDKNKRLIDYSPGPSCSKAGSRYRLDKSLSSR